MKDISEAKLGKDCQKQSFTCVLGFFTLRDDPCLIQPQRAMPTLMIPAFSQQTGCRCIEGLKGLRIINEPTAARSDYGLDQPIQTKKTVLIFDFRRRNLRTCRSSALRRCFRRQTTAETPILAGEDLWTPPLWTNSRRSSTERKVGYL